MNFLRCLALQEKNLMTAHVSMLFEIVLIPDMLPSLFPSWSGYGLISTPVIHTFQKSLLICNTDMLVFEGGS